MPGPQNLRAAALALADHDFRVFPLRSGGKEPLRRGWQQSATSESAEVDSIWRAHPTANIGVLCSAGFFVVDTDTPAADATLRDRGMPLTPTVVTARGRHYYLSGTHRTRSGVLTGLDVRGRGGYVVGPGSIHPSGHVYGWEVPPGEADLAMPPDWLAEVLAISRAKRPAHTRFGAYPDRIGEGARNATLTSRAGSMKRAGWGNAAISAALFPENEARCDPPLPRDEVLGIAKSARSWQVGPPWAIDALAFSFDDRLDSSARLVLQVLCVHANDDGTCWPGVRRIASLSGLNKDTVGAAVRRLEGLGRIEVLRLPQRHRYVLLDFSSPG